MIGLEAALNTLDYQAAFRADGVSSCTGESSLPLPFSVLKADEKFERHVETRIR